MPFDPSLPANGSPLSSAEMRSQFIGLFDAIGGLDHETSISALDPVAVEPLNLTISNPPTQAQVEALRDKINELLAALHR